MMKPLQVLLVLLAVGALCALTMLVFPKNGVKIGNEFVLKFASFDDLFSKDTTEAVNVEDLIKGYEIDSTAVKDSISTYKMAERQKVLKLQFAENKPVLDKFFQSLLDVKSGKRAKIRVLHYGDSQIEGDRITSYIRQQLQAEFGGSGPGMLPLLEFVPNFSVAQTESENWLRYTAFGKRDTSMHHKNFGLAAVVSRFVPYLGDSLFALQAPTTAWVEFSPSRYGYSKVKSYSQLRMHYGNLRTDVQLQILADDVEIYNGILPETSGAALFTHALGSTPGKLKLIFTGTDSPDFYGISLESGSGVIVDNYAMRGSSGTIFSQMGGSNLAAQYSREPITLVILQYGGNTVPHIESTEKAKQYGKWLGAQMAYLKRALPNASFILIGPSDMSIKENANYVTYPFLPDVRDALKAAALKEGVAFWDVYAVMGGKNSMPSWVSADPPLAGPDYIHFTPQGAKYIAELFYKALHQEFVAYKNEASSKVVPKAKSDTIKSAKSEK